MRLAVIIAFAVSFLACAHVNPESPSPPAVALPELGCRRAPAELSLPVETQATRLSICAQLPVDRLVAGLSVDDLYVLMFNAAVDGSIRDVRLLAADGKPLGGRIADCFAGVMAQVDLGAALGGACSANVPIRVARARAADPGLVVASSQH